jgi:hypothetical protein
MNIFLYKYNPSDGTLTPAGVVDDFISLQYRHTYSAIGKWRLAIEQSSPNAARLLNADIIHFSTQGSGLILTLHWVYEDDKCLLTVSGVELKGIAALRIVLPPDGQAQLTGSNLSPEDYIKTLLDTQVVNPQDVGRRVSGFITAPYSVPGDLQLAARFDALEDLLEAAATTSQTGYKARIDGGAIHWQIYRGIDRGTAGSGSAVWSFARDSFDRLEATLERRTPSWTLVAGKGKDTSRITAAVGTGSGLARTEIYTDARDKTAAELPAEGQAALAEYGNALDVRADISQHLIQSFGDDWGLGDVVTVQGLVSGQDLDLRVTEVVESYEDLAYTVEVTLGYAKKTLKDSLRRAKKPVDTLLKIETD